MPLAAGYEINVSCPNIAAGGAAMGSTPEAPLPLWLPAAR